MLENKTILYIVKNNDTLDSISLTNNVPVSEIIRLNPLSKHRLIEGQPLILNIPIVEENRNEDIKILDKCDFQTFLYVYKELLTSSIFYKFAFELIKSKFTNMFNKITNDMELYNLLINVTYLPTLLEKKSDKELVEAQKEINNFSNSLKEKYINSSLTIDKLVENIELFILKLYGENYIEAEQYYELFTKEINKLIK